MYVNVETYTEGANLYENNLHRIFHNLGSSKGHYI